MAIKEYRRGTLGDGFNYTMTTRGGQVKVYHICQRKDSRWATKTVEGRIWFNYITGIYSCRLCGVECSFAIGDHHGTGFEGHA